MIKFILGYVWTQIQTTKHKFWVSYYIIKYIIKTGHIYNYREKLSFLKRAIFHDLSKYRWSEAKHFAKTIFDLKNSTYGSEEYKELLEIIRPAIDLHYIRNRHHPEFHNNDFGKMTVIDGVEMICDWNSACKRHKNGNISKSIEINQERFGYSNKEKALFYLIVSIIN